MVANQHNEAPKSTAFFKLQSLLNYSILEAKCILYKCFLSEEPLNFRLFMIELREHALTEKFIAFKNNKSDVISTKKGSPSIPCSLKPLGHFTGLLMKFNLLSVHSCVVYQDSSLN